MFFLGNQVFNLCRSNLSRVSFGVYAWLLRVKTLGLLLIPGLLYGFSDLLGFCNAATDEAPGYYASFLYDFSQLPQEFVAGAALFSQAERQLWLLTNTGVPAHWGPSDWGLLLGAGSAALLLSFTALLSATRPVEAIFSFLVLLLSLLLPMLQLEAEYVGAIHLMVYPGAILIFFSFATLTTDQLGH